MVPEQIVGDEHVIAHRREVAAHGADRAPGPCAHRQIEQKVHRNGQPRAVSTR